MTNNAIDIASRPVEDSRFQLQSTMARQLGEFEHQVLLAILRNGGESYSVPLVLELEERTGREVAQAAVFIALRRLEKKGLLTSRFVGEGAGERGHSRRYFKLTGPALERLKETRRTLVRLWEDFEVVLDER